MPETARIPAQGIYAPTYLSETEIPSCLILNSSPGNPSPKSDKNPRENPGVLFELWVAFHVCEHDTIPDLLTREVYYSYLIETAIIF